MIGRFGVGIEGIAANGYRIEPKLLFVPGPRPLDIGRGQFRVDREFHRASPSIES
jgi:hypothetical protein